MGNGEWGIFLGGGLLEFGEDLGEFVFGACEARAAVAQEFGGACVRQVCRHRSSRL